MAALEQWSREHDIDLEYVKAVFDADLGTGKNSRKRSRNVANELADGLLQENRLQSSADAWKTTKEATRVALAGRENCKQC